MIKYQVQLDSGEGHDLMLLPLAGETAILEIPELPFFMVWFFKFTKFPICIAPFRETGF